MSDLTKTEAIESLNRARGSIARMREQAKKTTNQALRLAGAAGGGAVSGYLSVTMPVFPGTAIDPGKVVAGTATLLAMSGFIRDETTNEFLLSFAGGVVAAEAADATRAFLAARAAARLNQPTGR